MEQTPKKELVDVSRLYTLRRYSESFNISYGTVYGKYMTTLAGRARKPYKLINVSGTNMIYVSTEEEAKLKSKMKSIKKGVTV